jgi:hypothetical protein
MFHTRIEEWICNDKVTYFAGLEYLDDNEAMLRNASAFRNTGCHGVIFQGIIGALDGWIVKIRCPKASDGAGSTDGFYCRKGFYGIT